MSTHRLIAYTDYKSPYAYLAKGPTYELGEAFGIAVEWRPYILNIPDFLGSARIDADGKVIEADRTPHQWRRARYAYMDCRRKARARGLVLRATTKIWDSSLAAAGMLFAQQAGAAPFRRYHNAVFARFWQREIDIEDQEQIAAVLTEAGADGAAFPAWAEEGRARVAAISREAEEQGVFGVPSFLLDGELFWGNETIPDIEARLAVG
ncbi:MAG TPA: DsbA family protein [Acetobacteraceae bacterium]|nr:DsbA family protein [Acetobacteraceae bacterium]